MIYTTYKIAEVVCFVELYVRRFDYIKKSIVFFSADNGMGALETSEGNLGPNDVFVFDEDND